MRVGLILIALFAVVLASGCVRDTGDVSIKFSEINVTNGTVSFDYEIIDNDTESESSDEETDDPANLTEQPETPSDTSDHDPCASKLCDDSVTTCPDSEVVTCENTCDPKSGTCSSCIPDCSGHEDELCVLDCGTCEEPDLDDCVCKLEFYCEGNGICTSDEWPDGEDCEQFNSCDDGDDCTGDSFDPNIQECVHTEICCDDSDDCTLDEYNNVLGICEFTYTCCGDGFCDEPGDLTECPQECELNGGDSDIFIADLDPTGNETVFIEGTGVDLTGWTIEDLTGTTYIFPDGFVVDGLVMLHTKGCPSDNSESELFWGTKAGECRLGTIWNDDTDTATLKDSTGNVTDTFTY